MTDFSYTKGPAHTIMPWIRPHPDLLNIWKEEVLKIEELKRYELWLCGAALEKRKTWDLDVIMTGKVIDFEELEIILSLVTQIGFECRQLIDINWNGALEKYIKKGPCNFQSISCSKFYETGSCTIEDCLSQRTIESVVIADRIIDNDKVLFTKNIDEKIAESLWKRKSPWPSQKHINRIKEGKTYKKAPILLTKNVDFRKIINFNS